jgi:hypothetical protein
MKDEHQCSKHIAFVADHSGGWVGAQMLPIAQMPCALVLNLRMRSVAAADVQSCDSRHVSDAISLSTRMLYLIAYHDSL